MDAFAICMSDSIFDINMRVIHVWLNLIEIIGIRMNAVVIKTS